jgi:hypothetical protein
LSPLESHLKTHRNMFEQYITAKVSNAKEDQENGAATDKHQVNISQLFPTAESAQKKFRTHFAKWVVNNCIPLSVGKSDSF